VLIRRSRADPSSAGENGSRRARPVCGHVADQERLRDRSVGELGCGGVRKRLEDSRTMRP